MRRKTHTILMPLVMWQGDTAFGGWRYWLNRLYAAAGDDKECIAAP